MNRLTRPEASEFLLDLGRTVLRARRHGFPKVLIQGNIPHAKAIFRLAQEFAEAPDALKLRAMVEDWPVERIKEEMERLDAVQS